MEPRGHGGTVNMAQRLSWESSSEVMQDFRQMSCLFTIEWSSFKEWRASAKTRTHPRYCTGEHIILLPHELGRENIRNRNHNALP